MRRLLQIVRAWILLWWAPPAAPLPIEVAPLPPEPVPPPPTLRRRRSREPQARSAIWSFRHTLLDRLDEYFVAIRKLRRHDPAAHALFSKIGFAISANAFVNPEHPQNLAAFVEDSKITFGGVLLPYVPPTGKEKAPSVMPSFIYFQKFRHPSRVQGHRGDVYALTILYDPRARPRLAYPVRCHVGITGQGVQLLREPVLTVAEIHSRRYRSSRFRLHQTQWAYPAWLNEVDIEDRHGQTPEQWIQSMFIMAFLTYRQAMDRIVVRVRGPHRDVAAFGIELPRAKQFFRDRSATALARDGRRKRIFHAVVQHDRELASGQTTSVRAHYRGLRTFAWNGYHVHIVFPTNTAALSFAAPGQYAEDTCPGAKTIGMEEAGEQLAEVLER